MKKVEFTPPKGFTPPEGLETFDSMATFQLKPNGRMCLVAIGDFKMPGYDKKYKPENPGAESGERMSSRYREQMEGGY